MMRNPDDEWLVELRRRASFVFQQGLPCTIRAVCTKNLKATQKSVVGQFGVNIRRIMFIALVNDHVASEPLYRG